MSGRLFFSAVSEASVEGEDYSGIAEVGEALQRGIPIPAYTHRVSYPASLSEKNLRNGP